MILLVGLGNPHPSYFRNRHNVGFMVLDTICNSGEFSSWKQLDHGLICHRDFLSSDGATQRLVMLKPTTFMNSSGLAVKEVSDLLNIPSENIIVFHDELDIDPGNVRIKSGGGNGGHNGLRSIDDNIGRDYWRVRIGIGHPGHRDLVIGHVLDDFSEEENKWLSPLLSGFANNVPIIINGKH